MADLNKFSVQEVYNIQNSPNPYSQLIAVDDTAIYTRHIDITDYHNIILRTHGSNGTYVSFSDQPKDIVTANDLLVHSNANFQIPIPHGVGDKVYINLLDADAQSDMLSSPNNDFENPTVSRGITNEQWIDDSVSAGLNMEISSSYDFASDGGKTTTDDKRSGSRSMGFGTKSNDGGVIAFRKGSLEVGRVYSVSGFLKRADIFSTAGQMIDHNIRTISRKASLGIGSRADYVTNTGITPDFTDINTITHSGYDDTAVSNTFVSFSFSFVAEETSHYILFVSDVVWIDHAMLHYGTLIDDFKITGPEHIQLTLT